MKFSQLKLVFLLTFLGLSFFNLDAQFTNDCFPGDKSKLNNCVAGDFRVLGAFLDSDEDFSNCNACSPGAPAISYKLFLKIDKTQSSERSFIFWAVLENSDGSPSQCISWCKSYNKDTQGEFNEYIGDIQYSCGNKLTLKNIILAWSTASGDCSTLQDPNNDITPKCYFLPDQEIFIAPPLFVEVKDKTQPCAGKSDGSIKVQAVGGTAPYSFTLSDSDPNTQDITNTTGEFSSLPAGNYEITVTDANNCPSTIKVTLTEQICCQLTVTCPDSDGGTYTCLGDVPKEDKSKIKVSDNPPPCNTPTISSSDVSKGSGCKGDPMTITRTYTISDGVTTTSCTQTFTVIDETAPVLESSSPDAEKTIECGDAIPSAPDLSFTDCGTTITVSATKLEEAGTQCSVDHIVKTISYTWIAKDACGNESAPITQKIIVKDTKAPKFTSVPANTTVTCSNYNTWVASNWNAWTSKPTASDDCNKASVSFTSKSTTTCSGNNASFTVVWTATDDCGNTSTTSQTIKIEALSVTATASCPTGAAGRISVSASGGCSPYTITSTCGTVTAPLTGLANGTYYFTVTDGLGCTSTTSATIDCPSHAEVCTYTQGAYGTEGGLIKGLTTTAQLDKLLKNPDGSSNPLIIGSLKTITLTTAQCVLDVLPSSGTPVALSANVTCSPLPAISTKTNYIYKNTLLGQAITLGLNLRLSPTLGGILLEQICGLSIPTGISPKISVNEVMTQVGYAVGGSKLSSPYTLTNLTTLADNINKAYDNCTNPCITNACKPASTPFMQQSSALTQSKTQSRILTQSDDFKVFPVPTEGVINLDMTGYKNENIDIKIFNTMSQLVHALKVNDLQQDVISIDLSAMNYGTYIISVTSANKKPVSKVIILSK